ncbi:GNAT family N-acetyltransferase [Aliiroseovarius sp. YM-037]|uniref:GNAT family N-acetyltransferase n=1 Tax=Aliiroseovarius sp. YM-037 TaxID=3341728 RepID=UPI003A7F80B2
MAPSSGGMPINDFETERLSVRHWSSSLKDDVKRRDLLAALENMLTPKILKELPPSMQVDDTPTAVSEWVDARAEESDVYVVSVTPKGDLCGLLILVKELESAAVPTIHMGYLFAEQAWGNGYATEVIEGVLQAASDAAPLCFVGGVTKENGASAHILRKLGFALQPELSTGDTDIFSKTVAAG